MGRPIVKLADHYIEWSTIADGPGSYGMTLEELTDYVREEQGNEGLRELPKRLARIDAKGTSSFDDKSAEDTIWLNRAGPGEKPLHVAEIIEFYVRRKEEPTPATLKAFRKGLPKCGPKCESIVRNGCGGFCRKCWGTGYVRTS